MGMTLRHWSRSQTHPDYEVGELGEIRKIDAPYSERLPQIWGRMDSHTDPEWLVTILDEDTRKTITIPTYEITSCLDFSESKYEED